MADPREEYRGTVEKTNEKGFKIDRESGWFNYSRFFTGSRPSAGDTVVGERQGNFANSCSIVGSGRAPEASSSSKTASVARTPDNRDRSIARQVALKGAVELAANGVLPIEDLFTQAETIFAWITEEPEAEDETVELPA